MKDECRQRRGLGCEHGVAPKFEGQEDKGKQAKVTVANEGQWPVKQEKTQDSGLLEGQ